MNVIVTSSDKGIGQRETTTPQVIPAAPQWQTSSVFPRKGKRKEGIGRMERSRREVSFSSTPN